jgi:hypothetical protein
LGYPYGSIADMRPEVLKDILAYQVDNREAVLEIFLYLSDRVNE